LLIDPEVLGYEIAAPADLLGLITGLPASPGE
jgi:hypothetical protein